jgi:hypothetical protein
VSGYSVLYVPAGSEPELLNRVRAVVAETPAPTVVRVGDDGAVSLEKDCGWVGTEAEYDLARALEETVGNKTSSLNRPGFSHFDENWLCVYDNHSIPGADLQEMAAVARLPKPRQGLAFDRVILVKESRRF